MIEVLFHPLFERHAGMIFIVIVLLKDDNVRFGERFDDPGCDRGFAGASAAANADD